MKLVDRAMTICNVCISRSRIKQEQGLTRHTEMSPVAQSVMVGIGVIFDVVEFASGLPQPGDKQHSRIIRVWDACCLKYQLEIGEKTRESRT